MYKIRRTEYGVELFDGFDYYNRKNLSRTTWEITKLLKKFGKDRTIQELGRIFSIDEKNAREDIQTVLTNLQTLGIKLEEILPHVSPVKYAPRTVHFDITSQCNAYCTYCLASDRMKDHTELTTEQIIKVIDSLPQAGTWLLCLSGGEPLLRKDLFSIIRRTEENKLLTQIFTNGMLISKEYAKRFSHFKYLFFQVSLDSHIQEHHDCYRGAGTFKKTMHGISNLLNQQINPEICTVITRKNIDDLKGMATFLHDLHIKYVRVGPVHPYCGRGNENKDMFSLNVNQLREIGTTIIELNKKYKGSMQFLPTSHFVVYTADPPTTKIQPCGNGRSIIYIRSNGLVYPCLLLVYPEFVIGDIKTETIAHIWKSSYLLKKIRNLTTDNIEKCRSCRYKHLCTGGCKSIAFYTFGSIKKHDPNFCELFNVKENSN